METLERDNYEAGVRFVQMRGVEHYLTKFSYAIIERTFDRDIFTRVNLVNGQEK